MAAMMGIFGGAAHAQDVPLTAEEEAATLARTRARFEGAITASAVGAPLIVTGTIVEVGSAYPETPDWQSKGPPKWFARVRVELVHHADLPMLVGDELMVGFLKVSHAWRVEPGWRCFLLLEPGRDGALRPRLSEEGGRLAAWRLSDDDTIVELGTPRDVLLAMVNARRLEVP